MIKYNILNKNINTIIKKIELEERKIELEERKKEDNTILQQNTIDNTILEQNTIDNTILEENTIDNTILEQNNPHLIQNKENLKFCFIISSYNNSLNIEKNLYSIIDQTYKNWRVIYINDNSTDNTENLYENIIQKNVNISYKFTYIKNKTQQKQMYNKYIAYQQVDDLEIVCLLDGDDWLSNNNVLETLKKYYTNSNNKVFTSDYYVFFKNQLENKKYANKNFYSETEIKNKLVRYVPKWLFKHLKTGYGILFKSIPDNYLKFNNKWLEMCTDCAEMYSVCEFSNGKTSQIEEILYVYNKDNSILYSSSYYNSSNDKSRLEIIDYLQNLPICNYSLPYIYIINLPFDNIKRTKILKQLTIINNNQYQFIDAIDGYENIAVNELYNNYLNLYKSKRYTVFMPKNLKYYYNKSKQHITPSSLGLLQSVFKVLNIFIQDEKLEHILILEDDIFILKDFEYYLFINNKLLENKDLVYLGCHNDKNKVYDNVNDKDVFINIKDVNYLIYGGYSIIISRKLAKFILSFGIKKILNLNLSWDLFLNFIRDTNSDFNFYLYFKELFIPDVCKDGINGIRDKSFYKDRGMILDKYYT